MQQTSFVFDLDGTIWDSRPWYIEVISHFTGISKPTLSRELKQHENSFKFAKAHDINKDKLVQAARDGSCGPVSLYEGVIPTLDKLSLRQCSLGIVSNLPGQLAFALMDSVGITQYFEKKFVVTPRPGLPAKPHPHGMRQLISKMTQYQTCKEVWFIGDTENDAISASSAGVKFAWASYGYGLQQPKGSTRVLQQFDELLEW